MQILATCKHFMAIIYLSHKYVRSFAKVKSAQTHDIPYDKWLVAFSVQVCVYVL